MGIMAIGIVFLMLLSMRLGVEFAEKVADGDLTATIDVDKKDEVGALAVAMRGMVSKLSTIVQDVISASDNVATGSREMSASSEEMSHGASEQAAAAKEASSSMEEMVSNIKQTASASEEMASTSEELAGQAEQLKATIGFFNIGNSGRSVTRSAKSAAAPKAAPAAQVTKTRAEPRFCSLSSAENDL